MSSKSWTLEAVNTTATLGAVATLVATVVTGSALAGGLFLLLFAVATVTTE